MRLVLDGDQRQAEAVVHDAHEHASGRDETITVQPLKTFPVIKDLVTDVSWNYAQNKRIPKFKPRPREADGTHRMYQEDVDRVQEFRKCIECYLCQDVCHVLRDRDGRKDQLRRSALHDPAREPRDAPARLPTIASRRSARSSAPGMCNITRCCTEVCPEHINITDNGIIPLKERVVDRYFDPVAIVGRKLFGIRKRTKTRAEAAEER